MAASISRLLSSGVRGVRLRRGDARTVPGKAGLVAAAIFPHSRALAPAGPGAGRKTRTAPGCMAQ